MRVGERWAAVVALLLLHFAASPTWATWPAAPDLAAGAVMLGALAAGWGRAAALGCAVGLLEGALVFGSLPREMLVFGVAGGLGAWLRTVLVADLSRSQAGFVFLGAWGIVAVREALGGGEGLALRLAVMAPASALLTAGACLAAGLAVRAALAGTGLQGTA